jgi:hypothetical protein
MQELNKLTLCQKRKSAGSMKQLGQAKRRKSCSTGGDVETPPVNVVGRGSSWNCLKD